MRGRACHENKQMGPREDEKISLDLNTKEEEARDK